MERSKVMQYWIESNTLFADKAHSREREEKTFYIKIKHKIEKEVFFAIPTNNVKKFSILDFIFHFFMFFWPRDEANISFTSLDSCKGRCDKKMLQLCPFQIRFHILSRYTNVPSLYNTYLWQKMYFCSFFWGKLYSIGQAT